MMKTIIQKTFKKSFVTLLVAVALASCTTNDDINPDEDVSGDLLLVEEKVNGQTQLKYEYDERNRIIFWTVFPVGGSVHDIQSFTYDNNDRLIAHDRKTGGKVYLKESYTYESGDHPVSGVWTFIEDDGNQSEAVVHYTYDQNTVTETVVTESGPIINTYTFDNKGNSINYKIGQGIIEHGDYDDKPGVYARHPWSWKIKYVNNYRSVKTTAAGMVTDHLYKYTYNDAGYPVTAEAYDRTTEELVETREYLYKKAN